MLKIVAPLSFLVMAYLTWATLAFPALAIQQPSNWWWVPAFMGRVVIFGLVVYYVARAVRRSQGIDVDLVYRELPPE